MRPSGTEFPERRLGWPSRREFYRRWMKEAFVHAFGFSGVLATLLGLIVPPMLKLFPSIGGELQDLIWEVPLAGFATLAIVRFLLAPYWLYQELERCLSLPQAATPAATSSGRVLDRLASQHLATLYRRCTSLYWQVHSPRRSSDPVTRQPLTREACRAAREWTKDLQHFLESEFGEAAAALTIEVLDPDDLLIEDSEAAVREFTTRAVKQIRALMQRAA